MNTVQETKENSTGKAKIIALIAFIVIAVSAVGVLGFMNAGSVQTQLLTFSSLAELQAQFANPTEEDLKAYQFAVGDEIFEFVNGEWQSTGNSLQTAGYIVGKDGKDGKDAESIYEIAVRNGFTGSEADFIGALNQTNTDENRSVYDVFKEFGFDGSEEEFMAMIKGETGARGLDGKNGVDGKDGVDGEDGKDGKDGVDGKDGKDGKDGADGADGTKVTLSDSNTWVLDGLDTGIQGEAFDPEIIEQADGTKVWAINGTPITTPGGTTCLAESKNIEFRSTPDGNVEWRYTSGDDTAWYSLYRTENITGPRVEMRLNSSVTPPVVEYRTEGEGDDAWQELYSLNDLTFSINPTTMEWELFGESTGISAATHDPYLEAGDPITVNGQEIIPQYWWVWDPTVDNGDGTYGKYVNSGVRANGIDGKNGV